MWWDPQVECWLHERNANICEDFVVKDTCKPPTWDDMCSCRHVNALFNNKRNLPLFSTDVCSILLTIYTYWKLIRTDDRLLINMRTLIQHDNKRNIHLFYITPQAWNDVTYRWWHGLVLSMIFVHFKIELCLRHGESSPDDSASGHQTTLRRHGNRACQHQQPIKLSTSFHWDSYNVRAYMGIFFREIL